MAEGTDAKGAGGDAEAPQARREPTVWEDPSIPVGLSPPRPRALLFCSVLLWMAWVVALVTMAWHARA